ncbi:fatty acid synthase [Mycetomoellerius zeteki]|uniref:fatty acid synthase n=1 Tax=Mycetomoellerius zeteki TaxID=64791 RepID=UPI00084E94DE|nr:PREDICTED: fatty acid synthase-like [Trachymyrmex zeteki]
MDDKETCRSWNDIDSGEEIVISGIAGRFPDSDNMKELKENLFNKIDLIRADHSRWETVYEEFSRRMGTINNIDKFDSDFFGLSFEQAHTLIPETRMLLEHSYEAIIDAGINPKQLQGKNTAVIIGSSCIESQERLMFQDIQLESLNVAGCHKSVLANMISHYLDLKGPSHVIDTACSSSLYAIATGYSYIMSGKCEDAIIGTTQLCLYSQLNLQFARLGVLSPNGYCRPFDSAANGYARSETVAVIYLQKEKNAKRIYAILPYIKLNNDGYKEEGITYPSSKMQYNLLKEFYEEYKIPTSCLDYVETHGTATIAGDPQEINAVYNVLCKNRETPLMIGSVKSNLGHSEPASGFNQIAKVIIAFETGFVPPNINYTSPRKDIDALLNGSICVIQERMPIKNGYVGISCYGFGGSNAHMLLKWNPKQKINNGAPNDGLPRLVILSGRTEESVKLFLNDIANHPIDVEYVRLLHDIHADNINGHPWRGYTILQNTLQQDPVKEIRNCESVKKPVWFIFSALGSQWSGMGRNLLKFHVFAKAIRKCDDILKPYGISVINIMTQIEESRLNVLLGIVAIQIGLVDLLTSLGITPDYMISHSAGELGCAYADKCLTIEQTILSAYFIGLACAEGKIIHSSMAVVNINYEYLKNICPADIEIVCYNSENSNVVCGPKESIQEFIKKLQVNNIYVKKINCNIPFHSSYIASAESQLLLSLNEIIPCPKKRSSKWISTSIPRTKWFTSASKLSSADYHTQSILNTVFFRQTTELIPSNAVVIEIAPDDVMQYVLTGCLHPNVTNIVLTRRTEKNIDIVLQGVGKLYNYGLQPQVANLYPPVEFPVSRGTPMISPSIRWDHSENWFTTKEEYEFIKSRGRYVNILLDDEDYEYMRGHVIDGRNLLPATGYLGLIWRTIGMMKGVLHTTVPIVFRDVKFIRATNLLKNNAVKLYIAIQTDGKFEITEGDSVVVTGTVYEALNPEEEMIPINILSENYDEDEDMTARDIYKELKLRGYQYRGLFRGLKSASISGTQGHIAWKNNWETFMDSMLQMQIIGYDTRELCVPTGIKKLVINPVLHASKLRDNIDNAEVTTDMDKLLQVRIYKEIDTIKAGGVEIQGLMATQISRRKLAQDAVIEEHMFVAHCDRAKISLNEAIRISAQLVLEDHQIIKVQATELVEDVDDTELENLSSSLLLEAFGDMPLIQVNITLLTSSNRFRPEVRGDLSTFCWIENNISDVCCREDLVHVVYSSLNFKDIMLATGKLALHEAIFQGRLFQYLPLGMEYVGFDANGQRIMGIRDTDCIANVIEKDDDFCWNIPDAWTFEEAATVPCVYSTVYLALYIYGKMKKGDKILIHSGTGGVGQAAIHLALKEGCEVFTTVGTSNKRNFIKKMFPIIPDEHIGNSRDTSFEQMIIYQTKGRGVDIVLNSLAEEKLIASVRCLAQNGRFLEIGKFDLVSNNPLGMSAFQKGISFHGVRLENMMIKNRICKWKRLLFTLIKDGLHDGTIKPVQAKIFLKTDVEEAFRYMASGKHTGKIIINIHEKDEPLNKHIFAYRRYYCLRDRSYIILGGLGGFGLELTDWLIFRGAKNIVLISRNGIKNGYQRMKIRLWKSYGVNVLIIKNIDVADLKDCEYLLQTTEKEASVDAIFNLGVVLKDGVLKNQTAETFAEAFQSKARATQMLDKLSRKICLNLRHFVVFSSVSCGRGNAGQTNYGMANSIMERICEKRAEEGLPGLAIQWGAVGDVGLVADMMEDDKELIIGGTLQQKISCCLDELDKLLLQSRPIVSSMVVAEKKVRCDGSLIETIANILNINDMKIISPNSTLAELGMDSMMTVEVKHSLEREFDIFITAQEIRNLTFAKLNKMSIASSDDDVNDEKKFDTEKSNFIKILIGITLKDEDFVPSTDFSTNRQNTTTEVFLIPGIDGCGTVFKTIIPYIKFSTSLLHYNTNNIDSTNVILERINNLTNRILSMLTDGKDFVIVGYSFGSLIAIEVARRLEAMNFKGRLVLIDGAPEPFQTVIKSFESDFDDANFHIDILTNIMEIYSTGSSEEILMELKKCESWDERINIFAKQLSVLYTYLSLTNLKTLCTTIYKHLFALREYDSSTLPPITSPITLLKCISLFNISTIEEDYGLHKVTQGVVKVHYIEGDHVTILKNKKVAAAINGELPFAV